MLVAFLLTLLAGGATSIGAALGVLGRGTSPKLLAGGLGLSAGVMLYVSFVELMPQGAQVLSGGDVTPRAVVRMPPSRSSSASPLIAVLDRLVPEAVSPHEFSGRMAGTAWADRGARAPTNRPRTGPCGRDCCAWAR